MKHLATILFLLLSLSFVTEYTLSYKANTSQEICMHDDAGTDTEEQEGETENEKKEAYQPLLSFHSAFVFPINTISLSYYKILLLPGYMHKPYTPPDSTNYKT